MFQGDLHEQVECTCAGTCTILRLDKYDIADDETYIDFYTSYQNTRLWNRLKRSAQILLNRDSFDQSLTLDHAGCIKVRDFMVKAS